MGGLLPFLANHEGDQARRLVAANQEGTALFVDSQGEVDTPASLFGDPPNSEEMQAPPEGRVFQYLKAGTGEAEVRTGQQTVQGGVPFFIVGAGNQPIGFSGAQPSEQFGIYYLESLGSQTLCLICGGSGSQCPCRGLAHTNDRESNHFEQLAPWDKCAPNSATKL
eukprot:s98_g27.t1